MAERRGVDVEGLEKPKWRLVGPGLLAAATGVGAGDLVATLIAGSQYGYALLWAAVIGCVLKIILVEGVGRWYLATGKTIFQGWRTLGSWTSVYFGPYIVIWGFVYGATAMSSTALPLQALFPAIPLNVFAVASGLIGLALVWFGRYGLFEKIMTVMVGIMFVSVVGSAVLATPNIPSMLTGLVPTLPEGSVFYVLGLAGGVGGTITLAAYGYWLREKGWNKPKWMKVMRVDNSVAYAMTGIFVICMLILGAELLYTANISLQTGDRGLLDMGVVLEDRYGVVWAKVFLIGFWASSFSSLLGVWHGVSLMFADFWANFRKKADDLSDDDAPGTHSKPARAYMLWLTIPPMLLLLLGRPFFLILLYGVLGSLFMPFLAITLLVLLNSTRLAKEWRNKWLSNVFLAVTTIVFLVLGANELVKAVTGA
ncbi:Nramp family divalent metal transporter [Arthrobacter agilis]|uniref:Nramp family divalent metal transporter n=1 Tax=Arthrobacter agilis TaxID=37921 RepID=UPI00277DF955|nr:Nramp family divalent metal transporter [Arthrobacter agilis]MDQ0736920.1 Mn2+/Fe2+ NRAMP family transporter [Arthrobacter agilis]